MKWILLIYFLGIAYLIIEAYWTEPVEDEN